MAVKTFSAGSLAVLHRIAGMAVARARTQGEQRPNVFTTGNFRGALCEELELTGRHPTPEECVLLLAGLPFVEALEAPRWCLKRKWNRGAG